MKQHSAKRIKNIHLLPGADEEEVRSRSRYGRRRHSAGRRMLIRLLIVAAVLSSLFLLWNNWERIAPESVLDWVDIQLGNGEEGEGYPYALSGSTVVGLGQVNRYLAVLTDSSLQFLNASAGCVESRPNTLTDPVMETAGQYVLITELGGNRLRLETRRETVLELNMENRKIYASDLLSSGTVAVVTDAASQSYISQIQVYNSKGDILYEYKSGKYLITDVSLAPGGKALAAVGTTAEGGALKSVLLLVSFSSDTPQEYTAADQLLYEVSHFGDTVVAVGDSEYWTVTDDALQKHAYGGMELVGYAASRKSAGFVMRRSGSTGSGEVWLLDSHGSLIKSYPFAGNFRTAACRNTEFLLLTDSTVFVIGGEESDIQINTPTDTLLAAQYRDAVMVLTLGDLQQVER